MPRDDLSAILGMFDPLRRASAKAEATGQNARQMVLNRDPRFIDLAALVSQLSGDMHATAATIASLVTSVSTISDGLARNSAADAQTKAQLATVSTDLAAVAQQVAVVTGEYARLDSELDVATAQLAAADEELKARMTAAEKAIRDEATTRAAADAAEALARAQADAAEARARADADAANQAKQDAAVAAEAAARQAADAKEIADRQAADVALANRVAALENYMPAVTSGRTSKSMLVGVGGTADFPVVFDAAAPDANYVPVVVLDAPNLTNFTIAGFKDKTKTGITVTIRSNVLLSVATTIGVTVIALKL